jgi:hypothetical protein
VCFGEQDQCIPRAILTVRAFENSRIAENDEKQYSDISMSMADIGTALPSIDTAAPLTPISSLSPASTPMSVSPGISPLVSPIGSPVVTEKPSLSSRLQHHPSLSSLATSAPVIPARPYAPIGQPSPPPIVQASPSTGAYSSYSAPSYSGASSSYPSYSSPLFSPSAASSSLPTMNALPTRAKFSYIRALSSINLTSWNPNMPYLPCGVGEILLLHDRRHFQWWYASNKLGRYGWVPAANVRQLSDQEALALEISFLPRQQQQIQQPVVSLASPMNMNMHPVNMMGMPQMVSAPVQQASWTPPAPSSVFASLLSSLSGSSSKSSSPSTFPTTPQLPIATPVMTSSGSGGSVSTTTGIKTISSNGIAWTKPSKWNYIRVVTSDDNGIVYIMDDESPNDTGNIKIVHVTTLSLVLSP